MVQFMVNSRNTFADLLGEIGCLVRSFGSRVDMALLFQVSQRQVRRDDPAFVQQFVTMTVEEHSPVPGRAISRGALVANAGRAIVCQRAVPLRGAIETVQPPKVIEE